MENTCKYFYGIKHSKANDDYAAFVAIKGQSYYLPARDTKAEADDDLCELEYIITMPGLTDDDVIEKVNVLINGEPEFSMEDYLRERNEKDEAYYRGLIGLEEDVQITEENLDTWAAKMTSACHNTEYNELLDALLKRGRWSIESNNN